MPSEELTLILRLKDEATSALSNIRNQVSIAAAAIGAVGLKAGADWDAATKTIVEGTGATGEALAGLQADYQAVARYGPKAAAAVADLNTHLGLQGEEMQRVAEAALKMKVDTNLAGDVMSQLALDADGAVGFLDNLQAAAQATGVSADQLLNTIGKNSARWQAGGGDVAGLTALVVEQAHEFGPAGLRGAMSEIMREVDKDIIPGFQSLSEQLGDTTGAVERTYEAGKTWRDTLREMKDGALAAIGPFGDVAGGAGLMLAGVLQLVPAIKAATVGMNLFKLALIGTGIGAIIVAIGALIAVYITFKEDIDAFLLGAWKRMVTAFQGLTGIARAVYEGIKTWLVDRFLGAVQKIKGGVDSVVGFFRGMKDTIVGNSIVPDMVNGVLGEFSRMGTGIMDEGPRFALAGTSLVESLGGSITVGVESLSQTIGSIMQPLTSSLQGWVENTLGFEMPQWFASLFQASINAGVAHAARGLPSWILPLLGGGSPGETSDAPEEVRDPGKPKQHLASGGYAHAGRPYMVGERGPELFVPSQSGTVLPNNLAAMIGAEVAKALRAHPPTVIVPPDEVTDAVLYRMPEREAIREFPREHRLMYHVRLRGADISARVVRGSVSITGALGERRNASLRVREPPGVTLAPADRDEITIDYPDRPYRAAALALAPVAYWTLDERLADA